MCYDPKIGRLTMKLSGCKWVDSYVVVTSLCWIWSMACLGGAEDTMVFVNTMGDGLWGTAANWSLDSVPTATSHAVINSGRVVFSRLVELGE